MTSIDPAPRQEWSPAVRRAARALLTAPHAVTKHLDTWVVLASERDRHYLVQRIGGVFVCTCPNGQHLAGLGNCKHSYAAHLIEVDGWEPLADGTWSAPEKEDG